MCVCVWGGSVPRMPSRKSGPEFKYHSTLAAATENRVGSVVTKVTEHLPILSMYLHNANRKASIKIAERVLDG